MSNQRKTNSERPYGERSGQKLTANSGGCKGGGKRGGGFWDVLG